MSRQQKNDEGFISNLVSTLLGFLLAAPILGMLLLLRGPFHLPFIRKPLSRRLRLDTHCLRWPLLKWLLLPLQWSAAVGFAGCVGATALLFWHQPAPAAKLGLAFLYLALAIVCALVFNVVAWLKENFEDPATQKKLAGINAERQVRQRIEAFQRHCPEALALHGALLVFQEGTDQEFSVETDHVLITPRNLFVIETKYKSGTIHAAAEAKDWTVTSAQRDSRMRNALNQAKNTARVMSRQVPLPVAPVPIVAIHGNDVQLMDTPANVVTDENLVAVIEAFEASQTERRFDPVAVAERLNHYCSADPAVLQRHVARAEQARRRAEMAAIVEAASLP